MKLIQYDKLSWIGIVLTWCLICIPSTWAEDPAGTDDWGPLVVHFEKNRTSLGEKEKTRIQQVLLQAPIGDQSRVFVVGYTDSSGRPAYNEKLSLKRAQAVRKTIINEFGLGSDQVIAIGQGERHPVADNGKRTGRSKNRRVEIYLTDAVGKPDRKPHVRPGSNMPAIIAHLEEARILMRGDRWDAALEKLNETHDLGGWYVGDWHALYGIVGFFKGVPLDQVRPHLETALAYDHRNPDAREFLSRVEARENVDQGRVTADMGQSLRNPIAVSSMAQQYEYLSLFGATARYHHQLDHPSIDVWECLDVHGEPVVYYFDRSDIYTWAFDVGNNSSAAAIVHPKPVLPAEPEISANTASSPMVPVRVFSSSLSTPDTIWESRLFR
jgi:hypothetical protein